MKKLSSVLILSVVLVAPGVVALDMTPEQAMQKMMNCVSCKPMMEYPELGPNIRYDIFDIENGFVSSFVVANEKLMPVLDECSKKCEATYAAAAKMSTEDAKEKLCPFCCGMHGLHARGDVKIQDFKSQMGSVTLVTSDTEEGIKAVHAVAQDFREMNKLLSEAAASMPKEMHKEHKEYEGHEHEGHDEHDHESHEKHEGEG
jgi:hypothetical protein